MGKNVPEANKCDSHGVEQNHESLLQVQGRITGIAEIKHV